MPFAAGTIEACTRAQIPIPPPFDDPPTFDAGYDALFLAWSELNASRDISPTPGVIPRITRKQVNELAEEKGWDDDLDFMDQLHDAVRAMDDEYIPIELSKRKSKQDRAEKRAKIKNDKAKARRR